MRENARRFAEQDQLRVGIIKSKNKLLNEVYATENYLEISAPSDELKKTATDHVNRARKALEGDDSQAMEELNSDMFKINEQLKGLVKNADTASGSTPTRSDETRPLKKPGT